MSWSVFHSELMALTGQEHISREQFSQKMAMAYHNSVLRHFDTLTAGGKPINTSPKVPLLINGFIAISNSNMMHHNAVNWIQQVGQYILQYWAGAIITGPTGIVTVSSTGTWKAPPLKQNYDFNIILWLFETTARIHIMTLVGTYTSTVIPGVTTPWSGAFLQTIP